MAALNLVTFLVLLMLAITQHQTKATPNSMPTFIKSVISKSSDAGNLSVFKPGNFTTKVIQLQTQDSSAPPVPLLIVSPNTQGYYPVFFFIRGFGYSDYNYHDLFHHIASHGIVVVSPKISKAVPPLEEIETSASGVNWLPKKLQCVVPEDVEVDLTRVAISGHGRGGKTAFALALGKTKTKLNVKIAALVAIDPVAGYNKDYRTEPQILTYKPKSFNLSIPITIIGTGLGNQSLIPYVTAPCAPNGVNHEQFYKECNKKCSHFVIADYGYSDILNQVNPIPIIGNNCATGDGPKDVVRRTVSGIVVAFNDAYFQDEAIPYIALLQNPSLAPTRLHPVEDTGDMPEI